MAAEPAPGRARRVKLIGLLVGIGAAVVVVFLVPDGSSHHPGVRASEPAVTTTLRSPTTPSGRVDRVAASTAPTTARRAARRAAAPATPAAPTPATPARTVSDPGARPQTAAFPPSSGSQFNGEMSALWEGVLTGTVAPARPAFFPESAYLQVKAISDAEADYVDRLLGDFSADLAAAHALLGPDASGARLLTVVVPAQYGHWVRPGTCSNQVGYFEVPNSRLVYRDSEGQIRSFGIASMISWRGTWYVVHLGAVLRSSGSGVVDDPEVGPGTPAYYSTC